MNSIYFENVARIRKLYLEYIFFEFENEPILFLCSDEKCKLYLCLCSDIRYGQKWIVTECNISKLKSLVREEIDITSVFLNSKSVIIICMDIEGNENSFEVDIEKVDRMDLPKEGTFIRCDKENAQNYLWKKEMELLAKVKEKISVPPILGEIVKSYESVFCAPFIISGGQKTIVKDVLREKMMIKHEFSIQQNEKYSEIIDNLNVNSSDYNDILGAA